MADPSDLSEEPSPVSYDHVFERPPGFTFKQCTKCGLIEKLEEENKNTPCDPCMKEKRTRIKGDHALGAKKNDKRQPGY